MGRLSLLGDMVVLITRDHQNGSVGDVKKIVEYLHAQGKSSLGASGFCWGAKVVALVGKDDTFNALVQLHPSLAEASDYEGN
jgi:dienelactone hydrolase